MNTMSFEDQNIFIYIGDQLKSIEKQLSRIADILEKKNTLEIRQ